MVPKAQPPGPLAQDCPLRQLFDLLGDKWTLSVLFVLSQGVRRYSELQRAIPGVSKKMLTQTLRSLESDGLVERTVYPVVPPRTEYKLTALGTRLFEPVAALGAWAGTHQDDLKAIYAGRANR